MTLFDGRTEERSNITERAEVGSNWHFALSYHKTKQPPSKVTQHVNFFPQNCHLNSDKSGETKIYPFLAPEKVIFWKEGITKLCIYEVFARKMARKESFYLA